MLDRNEEIVGLENKKYGNQCYDEMDTTSKTNQGQKANHGNGIGSISI